MVRAQSLFLMLSFAFVVMSAWPQGVKLLNYIPGTAATTANADHALQSIKQRQHLANTKLARLNINALNGDWISVEMPDGKNIQINRTSGTSKGPMDFSWIGAVRIGGGEAIFTVTDGSLIGSIRLPSVAYTIDPLGDELYVVSRVVREMIPPPDYPGSGAAHEPRSQSSAELGLNNAVAAAAAGTSPVVRILFAYTPAAASYFDGSTATAAANQALATLNQAFENSNVNAQVELAGTVSVAYTETGNFSGDLGNLRVNPTLVATRNATAADIVMTIFARLTTGDNLCGLAYLSPSSEYAYGIIVGQWLNAAGDCFAHEVGHIFGADHDAANASSSPFAYGHGYQYTPTGHPGAVECFRTIMAYDFTCSVGTIYTANNFSNPSVNIQYYDRLTGLPDFTVPSGNALSANNARVLNEQAGRVAAFRDSPGSLKIGAALAVITNFALSD